MRVALLFSLFLVCTNGLAYQSDIPPMYKLVAGEKGVPAKLFYALILNESRSPVSNGGAVKVLPWPWTVNYQGKSHYFPDRNSAFQFTKSLVDRGFTNFDVGLGQINWYWHKERFVGLWEAFNPYTNLSVAAKHFKEQYQRDECNTWELAVGCYHRPGQREVDKRIAKNYSTKVISIWKRI